VYSTILVRCQVGEWRVTLTTPESVILALKKELEDLKRAGNKRDLIESLMRQIRPRSRRGSTRALQRILQFHPAS
jgi:hypothetical protein